MPYTTRKAMHQQIKSAEGNIDTALQHLLTVKLIYEPEHPQIAEAVEAVMLVLNKAGELTKSLRSIF